MIEEGTLVEVPDRPGLGPGADARVVEDLDLWQVVDEPARLPGSPAQVRILKIHKEALVHRPYLLQGPAPDDHARPRDPIDSRWVVEYLCRGEKMPNQRVL